jgi:hypothetical protein
MMNWITRNKLFFIEKRSVWKVLSYVYFSKSYGKGVLDHGHNILRKNSIVGIYLIFIKKLKIIDTLI